MAERNSVQRKRKLPTKTKIINIVDDDATSSSSEENEKPLLEKTSKIRLVDFTDSDSNLQIVTQSVTYVVDSDIEHDAEIIEVRSQETNLSQDLFSSQDAISLDSELSNPSVKIDSDVEITTSTLNVAHTNVFEDLNSPAALVSPNKFISSGDISEADVTLSLKKIQDIESSLNPLSHLQTHSNGRIKESTQKLLELEEKLQDLQSENEALRHKLCRCNKPLDSEMEPSQNIIATIMFNNIDNYNSYKKGLLVALKAAMKLDIDVRERESNLIIEIFKDVDISDWVVIDDGDLIEEQSKKVKHKKKKKKEKQNPDLFVLDTTPFVHTKTYLQYESKFDVSLNRYADDEVKTNTLSNCFNCNESHNLRDCPHPRNYNKINAARNKFKGNQNKALRYHLEEDQKFAHLKPGNISNKLKNALGLRDDQLPLHIYRMRQLGYPPGWFDELQIGHNSALLLFDFEGRNDFKPSKEVPDVDPDKIVEYPGFNVPMERGIKDEYRFHGCPQYSKECNKYKMLEYARDMSRKTKDNIESCDMDTEEPTSPQPSQKASPLGYSSPTLNELETEKEKLLSELIDVNDDSINNSTTREDPSKTEDDLKTIDISGITDELNYSLENQFNSPVSIVKQTNFGTPVITSLSPYSRLPKAENFQQNVSDIINFENLPNSTGKYEQMVGVIEKVRRELKRINST